MGKEAEMVAPRYALAALGVGVLALASVAKAQETVTSGPATDTGSVRAELNRLEESGEACQPYLVFENRTPTAFSSLKLDLVLFDGDGTVADRLAVEAAPLPAGKTSLVVFQVPSLECAEIGRILLNGVLACEPGAERPCLDLVETESRLAVPFFK